MTGYMKSLTEYINEQLVDEGLMDIFKKFWNWLGGKNNKSEYDVSSASYDEDEKRRFIKSHTSDSISYKNIESIKIVKKIIDDSRPDGDMMKDGFYKTKEYLKTYPEAEKYAWGAFVFKSEELSEVCGLIAYTDDESYVPTVMFSEFLPIYGNVLNTGDIVKFLHKINPDIMIQDKNLIKLFNKDEIKLYPVKDKKNVYTV